MKLIALYLTAVLLFAGLIYATQPADARIRNHWTTGAYKNDDTEEFWEFVNDLPAECQLTFSITTGTRDVYIFYAYACPDDVEVDLGGTL